MTSINAVLIHTRHTNHSIHTHTHRDTSMSLKSGLSKADLYSNRIMCPEYDLLGIYQAYGIDFIVKLSLEFAKSENQTPEALRQIAEAYVTAARQYNAKAKKNSNGRKTIAAATSTISTIVGA